MSNELKIGAFDPAWPFLKKRLDEKNIQLENSADYLAVLQAMHDFAEHLPLSREQADSSVLLGALEEIKKKSKYDADHDNMLYAVQDIRQIASLALTTYKESKPSQSISREQAKKIASDAWDAALDEGDANNPTKGEYLKQFDKQ
jgi:hypothetical protein